MRWRILPTTAILLLVASGVSIGPWAKISESNAAAGQTPPAVVRWFGPSARDSVVSYPEATDTAIVHFPYVRTVNGNTISFDNTGGAGRSCYPNVGCEDPALGVFIQCSNCPYSLNGPPYTWQGNYVVCHCDTGDCVSRVNRSWVGNMTAGVKVLSVYGSPLVITFSTPVSEVGFQAQDTWYTRQQFTVVAYNGATALGTIVVDDENGFRMSTPAADGHAPFVGVRASCGSVITSIQVSAGDGPPGSNIDGWFGIGPMSFGSFSVAVPPIPPS